jgi:4-amino-4-deoxy-L-arabinose transferase-like glycosyltransferase
MHVTMNLMTSLTARPERALWALMAAQIAFWTAAPSFSHTSPPLDVIEMYVFGREHVAAVYKHPNLPGLVLEASRLLTGTVGWPAYLVSQFFIAVTFWAVFELGRETMDARRALAGALLLAGVFYFSWPTPEFNHNVAQMPFWAAIALFLWRATTRGGWINWALLGLLAGFGLWAKYSTAVMLGVAVFWILSDAKARRTLLTPGPYLALLLFAAAAAPQALFLMQSDASPLRFAAARAAQDGGILHTLEFLLGQAVTHLPFLIMLAAAGWFGKKAADAPARPERRALTFLLLMGLGPLALVMLGALVTGAGLKTAWATPMFNLSGLIVVALMSSKVSEARINRLAWGAATLLVALPALYFGYIEFGSNIRGKPQRTNWPQAEISATLTRAWEQQTHAPLRIVAGDILNAGAVGLRDRNPPSLLIDGDYEISPWVTPQDVARDGALVVWRPDGEADPHVLALTQGRTPQIVRIYYPVRADLPPLELHYVIVPPRR